MSDCIRLLSKDGKVTQPDLGALNLVVRIGGETDPAELGMDTGSGSESIALTANVVIVIFNGAADGRGFSLVKALRDAGVSGEVYAAGQINPDQLSMVFQTGYDGTLVTADRWQDYGEASWLAALKPCVNLSYAMTESSYHRSIWQARHSQ